MEGSRGVAADDGVGGAGAEQQQQQQQSAVIILQLLGSDLIAGTGSSFEPSMTFRDASMLSSSTPSDAAAAAAPPPRSVASSLDVARTIDANRRLKGTVLGSDVLVVVPVELPVEARERLAAQLFDGCHVRALYLLSEGIAASYGVGHARVVVVSVGVAATSCAYVVDGETLKHCASASLGLRRLGVPAQEDTTSLASQSAAQFPGLAKLWGGRKISGTSLCTLLDRLPEEAAECPLLVCGVGSAISGLRGRLQVALGREVCCTTPPHLAPFYGACIAAPHLAGVFVTREEYRAHGAAAVTWKCPV